MEKVSSGQYWIDGKSIPTHSTDYAIFMTLEDARGHASQIAQFRIRKLFSELQALKVQIRNRELEEINGVRSGKVSFFELVDFRGRPLGRLVIANPSRWTNCSIQIWLPNGWPRWAHWRMSSLSVNGVLRRKHSGSGFIFVTQRASAKLLGANK